MKTWKLEDADTQFRELARRALAHHPQRVTLGDHEAVVIVNGADFAALRFASDLVEFIRRSTGSGAVEAAIDLPPPREVATDIIGRPEDA